MIDVVEKSGSVKVKVFCTDPREGIHEITESKTVHYKYFMQNDGDNQVRGDDLGRVKFIALYNDKKTNAIAIYSDSDNFGNVTVLIDMMQVAKNQTS